MKLLTYERLDGTIAHGVLHPTGSRLTELGDGDLTAIVASGQPPKPSPDGSELALDAVRIRPPLLRPGKVLCAATNYQEHIAEGGGTPVVKERTSPKLFNKFDTSVAGTADAYVVPGISSAVDWEVELAVVIGAQCREVSAEDALEHVFGYATANDISLRSLDGIGFDRDTVNPWVGFFDWLEGKWSDGSAPWGPYLVTRDDVPDPQALSLTLTVNDVVRQSSTTGDMIHTCAELVAFASRLCTLFPGDIILTGTPSGVGATTSTFVHAGDTMAAEVEGLGRLITPVIAASGV
jgi:2-keto-4-pentenoate hydratase/2-oxohepta-3-ene-1,7-dioic acid hydratase in catechol pathway